MKLKNIILPLLCLVILAACDYLPKLDEVIPDRRTEYKKSETLPDLEVPPDLTVAADTDPLAIPKEESTTLSEFERQKNRRQGGVPTAGALSGDQWLSVQGGTAEIWPELKEFWTAKGYMLDLDDPELGVLETDWLESGQDGITRSRTKFRIFAEAGSAAGSTVLFVSSQRQEKLAAENEKSDWVDMASNGEFEKQIIGELNLHFYGSKPPAGTSSLAAVPDSAASGARSTATAAAKKSRAEMLSLDENKVYLSLSEDFGRAWSLTENAILDAGLFIENKDREKGLYYVLYTSESREKKKGLLSRLKFWGGEEEKAYQISLTGVGDKTELVVLNEKGEWAEQEEASIILSLLREQYNNAR